MKTEQKMRDFSLYLINILVWFLILWAIVFLVGIIFQWSGLTDQLASAFFGSGFCGLLLLFALALLNVTANLNIISKTQLIKASGEFYSQVKPNSIPKTIMIAGALIGIIILSLWFAEWRVYQTKATEAEYKIQTIADSTLAEEAIQLIHNNGNITELASILDAMSATIQSDAHLSVILPRKLKDTEVYYELTKWWYGSKQSQDSIADAGLPVFIPTAKERKKFDQMIAGDITYFTVASSGNNIRSFRLIQRSEGKVILLIDTSRRLNYSRDSF